MNAPTKKNETANINTKKQQVYKNNNKHKRANKYKK